MLHFFRLLIFLIKIDHETVLNWFGLSDLKSDTQNMDFKIMENNANVLNASVESSTPVSFETLKLILIALEAKVSDGFSLEDIELISFFIVLVRFLFLIIKYNIKTSFYITCIGMFAGFLWYRHLVNILTMYSSIIELPMIETLVGYVINKDIDENPSNLKYFLTVDNPKIAWYNIGELMYYAIIKGVTNLDKETGNITYIDPLSLVIARLSDTHKSRIEEIYYIIYNRVLPKVFEIVSKFWSQLSGIAAYALITRIGKRYCPYLIRWHWTFLLIFTVMEQFIVYFVYRLYYFKTFVLMREKNSLVTNFAYSEVQPIIGNGAHYENILNKIHIFGFDLYLPSQVSLVSAIISFVIVSHISFIIMGFFNAISGQYFHVPFFVRNTELHVGQRPRNSIYSGGNTPWQYPDAEPPTRWSKSWKTIWNFLVSSTVQSKYLKIKFFVVGFWALLKRIHKWFQEINK
jgi:hypothetical protein